jgi:GDP-L-fucose synthase
MDKQKRIFITGANGMVGKNIAEQLQNSGYQHLLRPTSQELDLRNAAATDAFFQTYKPEIVLHCAARVGGIQANIDAPVEFLRDNLLIGTNVLQSAHTYQVQKLINLGSSCIYPRACPQPMREDDLLTGPLEPTNEGYALAKISTLKLCASMHTQYGSNFYTLIPPNLYGVHEHMDSTHSHVIAGLMMKFHAAKIAKAESVLLWGTGSARREFLFAEDLAKGVVMFMEQVDASAIAGNFLNIGSGTDVSIKELAKDLQRIVGYHGRVEWDTTKPDGMPQKLMDSSHADAFHWSPETSLEQGLQKTYDRYVATIKN